MSAHARLSASAAERWLACPGSVPATQGISRSTIHSATGTFAHDIAAKCINGCMDADTFIGKTATVDGFDITCDAEMAATVKQYIEICMRDILAEDKWWVEMPLLEALQTVDPDFGGTADFVRYRHWRKHLRVVDFKYGSGVYVKAPDNPQLKIYALGALLQVKRPVEDVEVVIVQPRFKGSKPVRSDTFKAVDLLDFAADIREAAQLTRLPNAFRRGGKHCHFCPIEEDCPLSMKFTRANPAKAEDFNTYP